MPRFLLEITYTYGDRPHLIYTYGDRPHLTYAYGDRLLIYYQGQTLVLLTGTDPFYVANQVMAEPISPANRYGDRPLTFYRAEPNYPGLVRGQTPHFLMEIDFFIADRPPLPYTYRLWRSRKNSCNLYQTK